MKKNCPLCNSIAKIEERPGGADFDIIECKTCGKFEVTGTALSPLFSKNPYIEENKYILSGLTRQSSDDGKIFTIHSSIKELIDAASVPNIIFEKMDMILLYVQKKATYEGEYVEFTTSNDYPIVFAKNKYDMDYYFDILTDELGWLKSQNKRTVEGHCGYCLTMRGWQRLYEILEEQPDSYQAFVAICFDKEGKMDKVYEKGFKAALEEASYKPMLIKLKQHSNKIDDEIIKEIRRSGLLIADFTENRQNVYFEAGFAKGLGIPLICTCKKDYFNEKGVHFDTRQYNHILWETPEDLKKQLIDRIEAEYPKKKK